MLTRLFVCRRRGKLETEKCRFPTLLLFLFLLVGLRQKAYGNKEGRPEGWVSLGEQGGRLCACRVVRRGRLGQRCLLSLKRRG